MGNRRRAAPVRAYEPTERQSSSSSSSRVSGCLGVVGGRVAVGRVALLLGLDCSTGPPRRVPWSMCSSSGSDCASALGCVAAGRGVGHAGQAFSVTGHGGPVTARRPRHAADGSDRALVVADEVAVVGLLDRQLSGLLLAAPVGGVGERHLDDPVARPPRTRRPGRRRWSPRSRRRCPGRSGPAAPASASPRPRRCPRAGTRSSRRRARPREPVSACRPPGSGDGGRRERWPRTRVGRLEGVRRWARTSRGGCRHRLGAASSAAGRPAAAAVRPGPGSGRGSATSRRRPAAPARQRRERQQDGGAVRPAVGLRGRRRPTGGVVCGRHRVGWPRRAYRVRRRLDGLGGLGGLDGLATGGARDRAVGDLAQRGGDLAPWSTAWPGRGRACAASARPAARRGWVRAGAGRRSC